MRADEIDLSIIRLLWDGRKPYSEIAKELKLTTNTVRARVNRLINDGILQIIGLVEPDAIQKHSSAIVFFKIEPNKVNEALHKIGALKNVVTAASLSSCYDIMALIMLNEDYPHSTFIHKELINIPGVTSVETAFPDNAIDWQLRYVL
ncbi:MAG: Lrp/AsnC family transcriptional regulator [Proteobacteria bacterium]|nr:Lrp/AsnC family transcriptional regulator [Pseudomonadota bacterium]